MHAVASPPDAIPRLIVIDACNVARSSCGPKRQFVDCAGLLNVIRWLTIRDFEVNAFLPIIYKSKTNPNVAHSFVLKRLHELGIVSFTPARAAHWERPALINYDDLYVAAMAERHGGCILSGDRFHDVLSNPTYKDLHQVLRDRLNLRFLNVPHDFIEIGYDRLYKKEPTFVVDRGCSESDVQRRLYAYQGTADYRKAENRRLQFTEEARFQLLQSLDELMDELAEREAMRPLRLELPEEEQEGEGEEANRDDIGDQDPDVLIGVSALNTDTVSSTPTVPSLESSLLSLSLCPPLSPPPSSPSNSLLSSDSPLVPIPSSYSSALPPVEFCEEASTSSSGLSLINEFTEPSLHHLSPPSPSSPRPPPPSLFDQMDFVAMAHLLSPSQLVQLWLSPPA